MSTIANLTVALNADVGGFTGAMKNVAQQTRAMAKLSSDAFKATRTDAERYEIAIRKISDAYALGKVSLEVYQRSIQQLQDEYNGVAEKAAQAAKAQAEMAAAGARVFKQVRTPLEAYKAELADLRQMLKAGAIDQETFNRARQAGLLTARNSGPRAGVHAQAAAQAEKLKAAGKTIFESTRNGAERYAARLDHLNTVLRKGAIDQATHARAVAAAKAQYISAAGSVKLLADNTAGITKAQAAFSKVASKRFNIGAGAGIAALAVGGAAKHSIGLASDFQATSISMEVLMKDAKASKALLEDLYQYAARTPFEFPDVAAAGKQLLGFGVAAKDIAPTIKNLGELSSGLDIPLGELANLFGRNRNQAHIFSRDINEFTSRGIPIIQQLAKQFGVATSEVMGLVEAGKVGFKDVESAISAMTGKGGQFEGLTDRLSTSMKGLASTAKDDLNAALRELGDVIGPKVIKTLSEAAKAAKDLAEVHLSPEKTDLSKGFATDQARRNSVTGTSTKAAIRQAIKDNIAAQQAALKSDQGLNDTAMNNLVFNPANVMGRSQVSQQRLNDLAKERAALENRLRVLRQPEQFDTKGAKIDLKPIATGAASAARAIGSMGESFNKALASAPKLLKPVTDGFKKLEQGGKLVSDLKMQGDTFAMNARQAAIYKAKLDGVPDAILKIAKANSQRVAQMEFDRKQTERMGQDAQSLTDRFKSLEEGTRTPKEKLEQSLKDIKALEDAGFGTTKSGKDVLDRAKKAAQDEFKGPADNNRSGYQPNAALVAGSSSFYSAIARTLNGNKGNTPDVRDRKQALAIQRRQEVLERQQLAELRKKKVARIV